MTAWIYLIGAILAEVIATSAMSKSEGFTRLGPTLIMIVGYVLAFAGLGMSLKGIPVSVAYAVWAGVGTAGIAIIGMAVFGEPVSASRILGVSLVIAGVVALNLNGAH